MRLVSMPLRMILVLTITTISMAVRVYAATVYAFDPESGNTGVDSVTFIVEKLLPSK